MGQKYHFIGIKGSGMSALATILHDLGHAIQGSDIPDILFTQKGLEERQIPLYKFLEAPITKDMIVVVGNAYKTHEEVENDQRADSVKSNVQPERAGLIPKIHDIKAQENDRGKIQKPQEKCRL